MISSVWDFKYCKEHLCDKAFNNEKQKHNEWSLNNFLFKYTKKTKAFKKKRNVLVGNSTSISSNPTSIKISIYYQNEKNEFEWNWKNDGENKSLQKFWYERSF